VTPGTRRDQVVVVIGATSGIGRATALALAEQGARLVLAARSRESLERTRLECELRAAGHAGATDVLVVPTDVGDAAAVDILLDAAVARFGRVDVVVHAAAVLAYGRFEDVPADVFDRIQTTNITGTANVARSTLRVAADQGHGHLVVLGSVLGKMAAPLLSSYSTSKWAVHGLVRALQIEARSLPGVDISLVSPGGVDTPIYLLAGSYAGRVGRPPPPVDPPEKVARAILRVIDRPRREKSVGSANGVMVAGFRFAPAVFDRIVLPLMRVAALSREPVAPHPGNVLVPTPSTEAVHGRWGRHWLRGAGLLGVAAPAAAAALVSRRRR
jgi:NAD(P)-dependent dehydrogenase (short-subunit alcohol dehydrogenase family)